jgi:hypothetical protein
VAVACFVLYLAGGLALSVDLMYVLKIYSEQIIPKTFFMWFHATIISLKVLCKLQMGGVTENGVVTPSHTVLHDVTLIGISHPHSYLFQWQG